MGGPDDFAGILNGVMWFQVALATVFIALRLYTRHYIIRNIGWDDILMIVNLVGLILTFFYDRARQCTTKLNLVHSFSQLG